ncbi:MULTISPECIES: NAD(P)H:quinone oxidoreductase [Micromonospora]|uniref:NAD(P)H:quinone oxidoreductase n=1 Tax=Micromonospora TaxID=1873 RepID=UPI000CE38996|nr:MULTISPECIES: NAD(P)H:quinone oxidoreductase [Micromonospora]PPA58123.1 NAD(P)H:quinone oxidoreductase, type IV [Micromonospora chalcea]RBQ08492.1 NAD(P)H:quinone oxidoreductase [Micromonospora sp. LHW51205]
MHTDARIAVIYYSATGTVHRLAQAFVDGAADAGAEVRLRRVAELAPEHVIDAKPQWRAHLDATGDIPVATLDDLRWANGYAFGTPTRFGNICSQLRQFLDTTTGPWQAEELADKPATGFTASYEEHGGQEATLLSLYQTFHHWGSIILPTGYLNYDTAHVAGGNPYGVSQVESRASRDPEYARAVLETACFQGARLTRMAAALAAARAGSKLG